MIKVFSILAMITLNAFAIDSPLTIGLIGGDHAYSAIVNTNNTVSQLDLGISTNFSILDSSINGNNYGLIEERTTTSRHMLELSIQTEHPRD